MYVVKSGTTTHNIKLASLLSLAVPIMLIARVVNEKIKAYNKLEY